jgi:peptidoglycan-associated lipoprotein
MKRRFTALNSVTVLAFVAALAFGLAACKSTTGPEPAPEPEPQPSSEFQDWDVSEPVPVVPEPVPEPVAQPVRMLEFEAVYFDFDDASIRSDARPVLRKNAEQLRDYDASITIEGHCDERGNEEYNLALGERRAHVVKEYLANLGVAPSQLRTVSYGEAKPAVMGHNESAWQYNRRTDFRAGR